MDTFLLITSYFILWFLIMVIPAYGFYKLPVSYFYKDNFIFKKRRWELEGKLYERLFLIKKWKGFLPDGARIVKGGFQKKHLKTTSKAYLEAFAAESRRAEATHLPPIFLSLIFAFYNPINIVLIMVCFGFLTNLPCIITQRYNRIKIERILEKYARLEKADH